MKFPGTPPSCVDRAGRTNQAYGGPPVTGVVPRATLYSKVGGLCIAVRLREERTTWRGLTRRLNLQRLWGVHGPGGSTISTQPNPVGPGLGLPP
ncbi:hypothetical protein VTJ04DRAFT_10492 [Mycothermus thermophilus]|uniref:uncharacterized protein n=1 Tax=Humicola insolens TaxID=85995 RepID=UPI003742E042